MSNQQNTRIAWLAILLAPISGLGIDIFTPALPVLSHLYNVSGGHVKLSVGLYLFAYGISQIIWGPLSDRYGRKSIIIFGLYGFMLCSIAIPFQIDFNHLLALRILQGILVGAINTPARAVIVDLFTGKLFTKYINYTTIAWALSPIIAPVIGAHLTSLFNWHACFYALAGYSLLMVTLSHAFLTRTNPVVIPFHPKKIIGSLSQILGNRMFHANMCIIVLSYSVLVIFYVTGPFIIQEVLRHPPVFFGHFAAAIGGAWLAGNIIARTLLAVPCHVKILLAIAVMCLVSVMALVLYAFLPLFWLYAIYLIIVVTCASVIFPNAMATCLSIFRHQAGMSSALVGSIFWMAGGLMSVIAGLIDLHQTFHLFIFYSACVLLLLLAYIFYLPNESPLKKPIE